MFSAYCTTSEGGKTEHLYQRAQELLLQFKIFASTFRISNVEKFVFNSICKISKPVIIVEVNQQGVSTNICWYLLQFIILTRLWTCTFLLPYIYMYW